MIIREEKTADIEAIFEVTKKAFENHPYSRQTEPFIVNALRRAGALTISLVAEQEGKVAGHIAFSPAGISDGSCGWYMLGPVSVQPERQRQGIGRALILDGLARLKALGAQGCVLVGDPAFYHRFGFRSSPGLSMEGVPGENVMGLSFSGPLARGVITHHPAFSAEN